MHHTIHLNEPLKRTSWTQIHYHRWILHLKQRDNSMHKHVVDWFKNRHTIDRTCSPNKNMSSHFVVYLSPVLDHSWMNQVAMTAYKTAEWFLTIPVFFFLIRMNSLSHDRVNEWQDRLMGSLESGSGRLSLAITFWRKIVHRSRLRGVR